MAALAAEPAAEFSDPALSDAVCAFDDGKILTRAQYKAIAAVADPNLPPLCKKGPGGFVVSKRSRVGWERFTYTDDAGRTCMKDNTVSLPKVDVRGRRLDESSPYAATGQTPKSSRAPSAKMRASASEPPRRVAEYAAQGLGVKPPRDPAGTSSGAGPSAQAPTSDVSLPKLVGRGRGRDRGGGGRGRVGGGDGNTSGSGGPRAGGSGILPDSVRADVAVLHEGQESEARAWKELASMRRAVQAARAQVAQRELKERRMHERKAYEARAFADKATFEGVQPAGAEEQAELSARLNAQIATLEGDPQKRSWFKLFKHMDLDGSGKVTWAEFREMVRGELVQLSEEKLPDERLKMLWRALDDDGSGYITCKEFGHFMKKGEMERQGPSWKQRALEQNRGSSAAVVALLNKEKNAMAGVQPAEEKEVVELSCRFNREMHRVLNPGRLEAGAAGGPSATWYKLFVVMDDDKSGKATYKEFSHMVRSVEGLGLSEKKLPEERLKSLWRALDDDGSGYITVKEFGGFMKRGELGDGAPGWKERRTQRNLEAGQAVVALLRKEKDAMAGVQPAAEEEVAELSCRFNAQMATIAGVTGAGYPAASSWFKLFKHMDLDGSGQVTWSEFREMVRGELVQLSEEKLPDERLKMLWRALDDDGSGYITCKEFGHFMKKGERGKGPGWLEKRTAKNLEAGRAVARPVETPPLYWYCFFPSQRDPLGPGLSSHSKQRRVLPTALTLPLKLGKLADVHTLNMQVTRQLKEEALRMEGVRPAPAEEVIELAQLMHFKMVELSHGHWFHLFTHMDQDKSGKVTWVEFKDMCRAQVDGLGLRPEEMPEERLKSLWRALDDDGSGYITVKEFGQFMKKGEGEKGPSWLEKRTAKNLAAGREVLAQLNKERTRMAGVPPAEAEEVKELAERLHAQMIEGNYGHWFKLFQAMDLDRSGQITFSELQDLVRGELGLGEGQLPEEQQEERLRRLWVSLDDDGSGFITAKEFGQFMKRGAPASVRMSNLEARRMLGTRMRASLEQEKAVRIEEQLRAADRKQTAHRKEMAELKAELQQLNSVHAVSDAQVFVARLKGMKKQKTEASLAAALGKKAVAAAGVESPET